MRCLSIIWLCMILPVEILYAGEKDGWETYRSEKFGYELSYPTGTKLTAYFDGSSGELKDPGTGGIVALFDVWPPDNCPRQQEGTNAREIGIQLAKDRTQADGDSTSSHCGDPLIVRKIASLHGVEIYGLEMTCVNETFPSDSDDDETDAKQDIATTEAKPIITVDEKKRPAYFADISQPWRKRILIVDPIITDLQADEDKDQSNMALVRTILARLKTFSIPKPPGICIEDLPNRGRAIGSIPVR